ncbi:antitoxin Xre/MbcA/ParS toxin-binding domain-containing protein [Azospirillum sp.]|uniref:antitoxin Xre/MbcA/ParS toxin-binding domain-containing protein n=1 Tax=Azospirillum sp. TaxID=34012 RepID=UPI003D70AC44
MPPKPLRKAAAAPASPEAQAITQALLRAADQLAMPDRVLAKVIGVPDATLARLRGGEALPEEGKAQELAVLFTRLWRSLDAIVDGDGKAAREWMNHHNPVLDGTPMETVQTITGLVEAIHYLDAPKPIF